MPIHDLHGNIAALINLSDGSHNSYSYSAFGEEESSSSIPNPWRFASKRLDPETGFVYYGKRYYIPELGRWLTPDPLGPDAGSNLYVFVSNAPLTHYDLYGLIEVAPEDSNLINYPDSYFHSYIEPPTNKACVYFVGSQEISNCFTIFVNGINTTKDEAMNYAKSISDLGKGMKVRGIYNPTSGMIPDGMGACFGMFGKKRHATTLLAEKCSEFLSLYPSGPQVALLVCHSDGATHVYNYLKNKKNHIQKRFLVLAIAPATVISKKICFDSYNYASRRDFIPLFRYIAAVVFRSGPVLEHFFPSYSLEHFDELEFLSPAQGADWFDHSFSSPTFEKPTKDVTREYLNVEKAI